MADAIDVERWLPVPGFEGRYEVSDRGRVWSHYRYGGTDGRLLKLVPDNNGYPVVTLHLNGVQSLGKVHRMVMAAFVGPCPDGREVRHLDGDPTNADLRNLAYGTHSENVRDSVRHGTHPMASRTVCPNGHLYGAANTYMYPKTGSRRCRRCHAETERARRWREKAIA